ncbi:hypothetical protein AB205_0103340 [Aquarana catesbeiana]|uniref:Uncharacterized protein n=1 Tax=Aquarana catesbeiana TaxID=8400 RepID=A0A2G9S0D3_AQUCT|nr:hypothetical protein AB205_0103340 [Aquarana catesbeiana]
MKRPALLTTKMAAVSPSNCVLRHQSLDAQRFVINMRHQGCGYDSNGRIFIGAGKCPPVCLAGYSRIQPTALLPSDPSPSVRIGTQRGERNRRHDAGLFTCDQSVI